jgi:hypothetical protein
LSRSSSIEIGQTSVAKYMARRRGPPYQGWKKFLRNHADDIADGSVRRADDFLSADVWPVDHGAWSTTDFMLGVMALRPPNGSQIRSRQLAAGTKLPAISSVIWMGPMVRSLSEEFDLWRIRDRPTSPRSPWQSGYAERLIGSIRRECVDHIIVTAFSPELVSRIRNAKRALCGGFSPVGPNRWRG